MSAEIDPPVRPLRATLIEKLTNSRDAWDSSVTRFRALYWICLTGVIVVPTCLASLKQYMAPLVFDLLSVVVAIFGSVQAIVKPSDKFMRDIEFRDETDFILRQAEATADPTKIAKLMKRFEAVERRFHQGAHPWPVPKRPGDGTGQQTLDELASPKSLQAGKATNSDEAVANKTMHSK